MLFVEYNRCGTCRKAKKWLVEHDIEFIDRPIKDEPPTIEELKKWHELSGLPLKRFFNTSGQLYRSMGLKDRLKTMSEDEMYEILATDGMLVKRPILVNGDTVLVGFKETEYESLL